MRGAYRIPAFTDEAIQLGREIVKLLIRKGTPYQTAIDALDAAEYLLARETIPISVNLLKSPMEEALKQVTITPDMLPYYGGVTPHPLEREEFPCEEAQPEDQSDIPTSG